MVAEVLSVEKHPNADKLTVCRVNAGKRDGAGGLRRAERARRHEGAARAESASKAVRGVESHGMLASARELGLSDDHSGLLELPAAAKPGADVRKLLGLDDHVMTLKLTPNRADCLSVLGVAREVAALTGCEALIAPAIKAGPAKSKAEASGPHHRAAKAAGASPGA